MNPLVSVVLATFNRACYLYEAATSILEQTFPDFELLIVDDCSTDRTADVITGLISEDHRVKALRTNANSGCNLSRNLALQHAKGDFIAFLDDDDIARPERLEKSLQALEPIADAGVISVGYRFIDGCGTERSWSTPPFDSAQKVINSGTLFELLYCDWSWFPTSTLMFRSSAFGKHPYPPIRRSDGDSVLLLKMAATGTSLIRHEDDLCFMRRDSTYEYMSQDTSKLMQARRQTLHDVRHWLNELGISEFNNLHRRAWSNHLVKEAESLGGFSGLGRAMRVIITLPFNRRAIHYFRRRLNLKFLPGHRRFHGS